jgi:hypothetical protein
MGGTNHLEAWRHKMREMLNKIREPEGISSSKKIGYTTLFCILGMVMGIISKILDTSAINELPYVLQVLDLGNFLSRLGVWLFFGVMISVYSKSPMRAALNVLMFFAGMVGSYYYYTVAVAGFFPKSYMMIWVALTILSPVLAFVCWYAKGKGLVPIILSSAIFMFMTSQTFVFGFWYFDLTHPLELLIWIATILVLYQSPGQIAKVVMIGMVLFIIVGSQVPLYYGLSVLLFLN